MQATLILKVKDVRPDGAINEMVVWRVPIPIPPCTHYFKYRLVHIVRGVRVIGFDNERGKGDHMHIDGAELAYSFSSVEQLVRDFIAAVKQRSAT